MPPVSPGRTIQGSSLGGDRSVDARALAAWKPGELAILLSLRHDLASLDVPSADRQWAGEDIRTRDFAFRCLSRNQRDSHLAVSLDRPDPALENLLI